jgi:hypothetical protein
MSDSRYNIHSQTEHCTWATCALEHASDFSRHASTHTHTHPLLTQVASIYHSLTLTHTRTSLSLCSAIEVCRDRALRYNQVRVGSQSTPRHSSIVHWVRALLPPPSLSVVKLPFFWGAAMRTPYSHCAPHLSRSFRPLAFVRGGNRIESTRPSRSLSITSS